MCQDHLLLKAYVGGSLDAIAVLSEHTQYLSPFYCKDTSVLFDADKIIDFMVKHNSDYRDKNAMLLVVRYLQENGGCQ